MNIQFRNFKRIDSFLSLFFPQLNFEKKELNKDASEKLIYYLIYVIDALLKSENLFKKRNLILSENKGFFPERLIGVMENINIYLYKFNTKVFKFTRTECQTFIFIIENLIDYFKNIDFYIEKKDKKNLFVDYRFWIENFFKIFDQKITGSIYSNKKTEMKDFIYPNHTGSDGLIFSNSSISFSIFPFVIKKGDRILFLFKVTKSGLIYKDVTCEKEFITKDKNCYIKVFEFLFSNFEFGESSLIKKKIEKEDNLLLEKSKLIEDAYNFHREKLFSESLNVLKEISFEDMNLPLVYLLQIKNLVNLNRGFEVKKIIQKFTLFYPYYADGYEIMGDIYLKEENFKLALNYYERVLKLVQNKRVAEKFKRVKDKIGKSETKDERFSNDYIYDLTESVFQSDEQIIFREKELRQMVEILISRSRKNLMLIGDSGVGKTALIRLLAQKVLDGDIPDPLKNKRIKEINFVALLTGSKYRGQFEEKILKFLSEFKLQNAILVLENIHLMMSVGIARGTSLDLVNILKQFLREGSIQVIATTNYEEYKNNIEKDNALLSFFQKFNVNELSIGETKLILSNLSKNSFSKENIIVSEEIIDNIVESAKRNVREKKLPDSAIMIFERCISKVKFKIHLGETDQFEVNNSDVVEVLSDILNLPESNISVSLKNRLSNLKINLLSQIVGQNEIMQRITSSVMTSKLEFDVKSNRPDGVFLFIGPTGVGKTETAIALAKALYGTEDFLIRIDMSEYMEKFTYSRFVGAAPGYVGYYDSNQLTDKVRQNPFSVILLDEVEKADSQLMNIFLQVFDAGRLTDARGNIIDFSHSTIIMTSNIGTSLFSKVQMGYQSNLDGSDVSRSALLKLLKRYFSMEFLNRVDEILIFNHLEEKDLKKIADIQLKGIRERLEKQGKELVIKGEVVDYIIINGYSREYGARNIARVIKTSILEKIADISLKKEWGDAKYVVCSLYKNEIEINLEPDNATSLDDSELMEQENVE